MKERLQFFLFLISEDDFDLRVGLVVNYVGGILVPSILLWRLVRLGSSVKQLLSGFALGGMFLMASFIMGSTVRLLPNQKHHNVVWPRVFSWGGSLLGIVILMVGLLWLPGLRLTEVELLLGTVLVLSAVILSISLGLLLFLVWITGGLRKGVDGE